MTAENVRSTSKQPQVVLGPDGKPCRACNSKLAFAAAMKGAKVPSAAPKTASQDNASTNEALAAAAATAAVGGVAALTSDSGSSISSERACPPDGEELGRSAWTLLHSSAAYFPENPSAQQQSSMLSLFRALPYIYPCHSCAEALGEEYKREEKEGGWEDRNLKLAEAVRSGPSLRKWLCGIHNEVNQRLGSRCSHVRRQSFQRDGLRGPRMGAAIELDLLRRTP